MVCVNAAGAEPVASREAGESRAEVLVDALLFNRKAMVSVNLRLGGEEAARFWPVYERYQQEMAPLADRLETLVEHRAHDAADKIVG